MINFVEKFLIDNDFTSSDKTVIVGFSGGFDSTCLLHILYTLQIKMKFRLVAAHLNHNWRGDLSENEMQNCGIFCEKNKIEFFTQTLEDNTSKTETAARKLRYDFFSDSALKFGADGIFLAHNKNDNVETLIYRVIKGTGTAGLCGIEAKRNFRPCPIYRPLLDFSREDIENYCASNGLNPNNDLSNFDIKHARNLIRHDIIPIFKKINPNVVNAIANLSFIAASEQKIIEKYLRTIENGIFTDNKFDTEKFVNLELALKHKLLHNFLISIDIKPSFEKINNILEFIQENYLSKTGKTLSLTENLWLFINTEKIYTISDINMPNHVCVEITGFGEFKIDSNIILKITKTNEEVKKFPEETEKTAFIDMSKISFPLTLRCRREGDFIQPFGMDGTMKLKKYFINKSIAKHNRDKIFLLTKNSEVLWAIGVGISEKLRAKSKPDVELELKESL